MPSSQTTAIFTLSLHDALPICRFFSEGGFPRMKAVTPLAVAALAVSLGIVAAARAAGDGKVATVGEHAITRAQLEEHVRAKLIERSEEHTSELQSPDHLVCRLLRPPLSSLFPYTTLFRSVDFFRKEDFPA